MTIDGSRKGRVSSMDQIFYRIRPLDVLFHFLHDFLHLVHLFFQVGTVREVVPLNWLPILVFSLSPWPCVCPPPLCSSRVYLLWLISILNSWFWRVNSAIAVAIDCTCWTDNVCMTGADWRSRWGSLEAPLLPWRPRLVALDLVLTILTFCRGKENCKTISLPTDGTNWYCLELVRWMLWLRWATEQWKAYKKQTRCQKGDRRRSVKPPPMAKLVSQKWNSNFLGVKS